MSKLTEDEILTKKSYNTDAENWEKYFDSHVGWPKELAKFHELLPKGRVLDVGAGTGRDAKGLIKLGYQYTGTDISEGLLEVAKKELPGHNLLVQSVYDLKFSEKFDGFWASAVLLHVPRPRIDEALLRIKSVVKNNAIGFISVKDGHGEEITEHKFGNKSLKRFFVYWDKNEFIDVLNRNGYEVLDYTYRPVSEKTKWHIFIVKKGDKSR